MKLKIIVIIIVQVYFGLLCICSAKDYNPKKNLNLLDSIYNCQEIENLIVKIDDMYCGFKVNNNIHILNKPKNNSYQNYKKLIDSLQIKPLIRADYDSNGFTDLLVMGKWNNYPSIICILDSGNNHFWILKLTNYSFQKFTFPILRNFDTIPLILYYSFLENEIPNSTINLKIDTLIFKYGDFIEYCQKPKYYKIEKIEFSTGGCFGTCPIFDLTIFQDSTAIFNAKEYNKKKRFI